MDGDQPRPEPGSGSLAGEQQQEAEQPEEELQGEGGHGGEAKPGVDAVEVEDGILLAVWTLPQALVVPDGEEGEDDAGDGEEVEDGVEELRVDTATAGAGPVDQHTWTGVTMSSLENAGQGPTMSLTQGIKD